MSIPAEQVSMKAEVLVIEQTKAGDWEIFRATRRAMGHDRGDLMTFRNRVTKVLLMTNPVILNQYGTIHVVAGWGNVFEITQMVNDVSIQEVEALSEPPKVV